MTDPESPAIVPADPLATGGRIVVGVDDSDTAAAALRWALREGVLRQAKVEVVHVWTVPVTALPFGVTLPVSFDESELDAAARDALDGVVDAAIADLGEPTPEIDRTVLPGGAAMTLVDVSADADLLVVGSHGRTGWRKALLGSTAQTIVQHATCPVVVLRHPDES
jgi:nucleotide-binding universal stress UspA family protein